MNALTQEQVNEVNGGILPAVYTVYYVAQYAAIRWGAGKVAGFAAGAVTAAIAEY